MPHPLDSLLDLEVRAEGVARVGGPTAEEIEELLSQHERKLSASEIAALIEGKG